MKRREFLRSSVFISVGLSLNSYFTNCSQSNIQTIRKYHLSISTEALDQDPNLFDAISKSGITQVWLAGWLNGYWYYPIEQIKFWKERFNKKGISAYVINLALGHPRDLTLNHKGNSLGIEGVIPNIVPPSWKKRVNLKGHIYSGISIHPPVPEANINAIRKEKDIGINKVFFDDDFRLGRYPGDIGGCFCDDHKQEFLSLYGYSQSTWEILLNSIRERELTESLRSWINYNCDQLTHFFKSLQIAAGDVNLGIMVMYLGAEKSGIRLKDYQGSMMRVGELMFNDDTFNPLKGKTDELYSSLFHRRYVNPELAFSETTAFPADKLSAKNMAAKLNISLFSDVRNTMYMSGLTAFPISHWDTLTPAMKKSKRLHEKIAGYKPKGPFKHYWGEASRFVGTDQPYSLFLASGVPFEVTDVLREDGWTFLSEFDARSVIEGKLKTSGTKLLHSQSKYKDSTLMQHLQESMEDIFSFKRNIIPEFTDIPYVEDEIPVVCSWYPEINSVLLWNLLEDRRKMTVVYRDKRYKINIDALETELLPL